MLSVVSSTPGVSHASDLLLVSVVAPSEGSLQLLIVTQVTYFIGEAVMKAVKLVVCADKINHDKDATKQSKHCKASMHFVKHFSFHGCLDQQLLLFERL